MARKNEIVGIFRDKEGLEKAINELESLNFEGHQINILGSNKEMKKIYGTSRVSPELLQDDPDDSKGDRLRSAERIIGSTATIGVSTYVGGCLGAMIGYGSSNQFGVGITVLGAIFGAGVTTSINYFLRTKHLKKIKNQIDTGGMPLWVQTTDKTKQEKAVNVMRKHGAYDVHANKTALQE